MKYQYQDKNLDFIKAKIRELRVAVFRMEKNAALQLPVNVIKTLTVEDDGTLLFFTSSNEDVSKNFNQPFYAYLDYHNKEMQCRLKVSGKASLVEDDDAGLFTIHNYPKGSYGRLVLVKMKIMQAEFIENKVFVNSSWTEKLKNVIELLLPLSSHRVYNFSK
jgi:hypothetical protein